MLITVGGPLLLLLSGCSSIDDLQRTHDVMATLQEADRQFTIESTPDGALPDDTQAKKWINDAIALMPHSDVPYVGTSDDPGIIDILGNRGRYPLLIDYLSKALKDPKLSGDYQLLLPLADAQERMGPQADASKTYTAALAAINKSFTTAGSTFTGDGGEFLDRARAEYYGGKRPQAIKDFNSIITTRPELADEAENNLAYFYALDKSDLPDAKKLAMKAVADVRKSGSDDQIGEYIDTLATSTGIAEHVKVDFELRGCPVDRRQLLDVLAAFLNNRRPRVSAHSVCVECKLAGNVCVMVAHGTPCLGPVTPAGCGALCPRHDRGCYGCFGPAEGLNTASLSRHLTELGLGEREVAELYRSFNANADAFRVAGDAHDRE